jgi:hypothetical protein
VIGWSAAAVLAAHLAASPPQDPVPQPPAVPAAAAPTMSFDGHVSIAGDGLPALDVAELRPQIMLDVRGSFAAERFRFRAQGIAEALLANRDTSVTGAIARVRDVWFETGSRRADLRVGYGRVIWGRLDEIQPSDVINPLDASRFLLDGRSEARLPVAFVRGRAFAREGLTIEGVLAPVFARGTFDELGEATSPFNLLRRPAAGFPEIVRAEPEPTWTNISGGGRVSATIGRVDVAGAVYRGFESFGLITARGRVTSPDAPVVLELVERYPRFTMVGGDFETVRGEWAIRGEGAFYVDRKLADPAVAFLRDGQAVDAGVGFDRRTGDYRVFGSVIAHREWSTTTPALPGLGDISITHVNVVASLERPFARDRYFVRGFAVVNPGDNAGFVRALFVWKVRDDVTVEGSAAAFLGTSDDTLGRFQDRDFLLARLRYRW